MTKIIFIIGGFVNVIASIFCLANTTFSAHDIMQFIIYIFNIILFFRLAYLKDYDNYELIRKLDKRISALDHQPRETKDCDETKNTNIFDL